MTKSEGSASSAAQRRTEARKRGQRRRFRRRLLQVGGVLALALVVGVGAAWLLRDSSASGDSDGQALYRFDTADFHSLAFDPDEPDRLFFGHHYGLKVSDDGGLTWSDGTLGEHDAMQQAVPVSDPQRHYIAGHDVFQVSTDGGQTWREQPTDLPALDIHGFAAAPADAERLYALEVVSGGFYSSQDGGLSWEQLPLPPGLDTAILPLAVGYDNPDHVFAAVGSDVLESLDGGQSWVTQPGPGGTITSLAIAPTDPQYLVVGTTTGLWQWDADAWRRLPLTVDGAIPAIAIHPTEPERIAVIDQQGNFYRSDDAGQSWASE